MTRINFDKDFIQILKECCSKMVKYCEFNLAKLSVILLHCTNDKINLYQLLKISVHNVEILQNITKGV